MADQRSACFSSTLNDVYVGVTRRLRENDERKKRPGRASGFQVVVSLAMAIARKAPLAQCRDLIRTGHHEHRVRQITTADRFQQGLSGRCLRVADDDDLLARGQIGVQCTQSLAKGARGAGHRPVEQPLRCDGVALVDLSLSSVRRRAGQHSQLAQHSGRDGVARGDGVVGNALGPDNLRLVGVAAGGEYLSLFSGLH